MNPHLHIVGMRIRRNINWFDFGPILGGSIRVSHCNRSKVSPYTVYNFPYVNELGVNTLQPLARISCQPQVIVSSFYSTCFSKLVAHIRKITKKDSFIFERRDVIAAIVAYYTVTQNKYMYMRMVSLLLRARRDILRSFLVFHFSALTENTRFVFCQIWKQIIWLTFRSRRIRENNNVRSFSIFNRKLLEIDLNPNQRYDSLISTAVLITGSVTSPLDSTIDRVSIAGS
jgi:hypothetical protein